MFPSLSMRVSSAYGVRCFWSISATASSFPEGPKAFDSSLRSWISLGKVGHWLYFQIVMQVKFCPLPFCFDLHSLVRLKSLRRLL